MNEQITGGQFLHGGDYNPEQWLNHPEILETDIAYFKKAHINTVTLGMFSWSVLEPEEGVYQFEWLEQIIDRMHEQGIRVILGTPSGARPKWLADKYPEVLRVDESRHRNLFGGRHNHCYTSLVYREKVKKVNAGLVQRFDTHPAVVLWHISNEFGGECHCPACQEAFRQWLKKKYETIEQLNERWCTTFWSHRYRNFEEVESPSSRGEMALHALQLDWKRFVTDQTVDYLKAEVDGLRDSGAVKPVTTNLMYNYNGLDYKKFRDVLDVVSWDNYPLWHKEEEWLTGTDCGLQHDLMRSIKKKPFLLMESSPASTNWQGVSKLKKPGLLHLASMQAVAHGADSVLYFQLRQSRGASEKFHGAVIDHYGGSDTRVFKEVTEVGKSLEQIREISGSETHAKAAILYDRENIWAIHESQGPRNKDLHYTECVLKQYRSLRMQGLNVDIISMEHELSEYRLLVVPMAYLFLDGYEEKLKAFANAGGTLVLTYWSGIVDATDRCFLGGTPYGLMDVTGVRSTEIDALYDWESNHIIAQENNHLGMRGKYECKNLCDLIQVTDAEVLYHYTDDFYQGWPALTHKSYGQGHAYYICADMEPAFYNEFYETVIEEAKIEKPLSEIPENVSVTTRENDKTRYLFLQNFGKNTVNITVPEKYELFYGHERSELYSFETKIYLERK